MLLHAVRVKTVDPENRVVDTIADGIDPGAFGKLHDPAHVECSESRIVKGGGTGDVGNTYACMVDQENISPCHGSFVCRCGR
jgi:hypothetical protein